MKTGVFLVVCCICMMPVSAQEIFQALVRDKQTGGALPGVTVTPERAKGVTTNDSGQAVITALAARKHTLHFTSVGYAPYTLTIELPDTSWHEVLLTALHRELEE